MLRFRLRRHLFQLLLEILRTILARVQLGEAGEKRSHVPFLRLGRCRWIVGGDRVQQSPGLLTELLLV
uniref:Putative secreted protein n=1 Tax=Anopheles marajoara TaxID=58244 RepID=A0A2M4CFJ2_9DIPT